MPTKAKRTVGYTLEFKRNLRALSHRYRRIKADIEPIITRIQKGETPGVRVPGTRFVVFKVRARNSDARKGKSGGYRIIYYLPSATEAVLVTIYSKSDQGDISPQRIRQIIEANSQR